MTKEVMIKIKGQQMGEEEDPIVMMAPGTYHLTNEKHYIHYEEKIEGSEDISKNTIKISSDRVIIMKRGVQASQMIFDINEADQAIYNTAFGNLSFDTDTKSIRLKETQDLIEVIMEYSLSVGGSKISENELTISILARFN